MRATTLPTVSVHFAHTYRPWWIAVVCGWCESDPLSSGCMVCGKMVEKVRQLATSEMWRKWKTVLLVEPDANGVVGDWLEENDWPQLADEARRTWTHLTPCPRCKGTGEIRVQRYGRLTVATAKPQTCHYCNATGKKYVVEVVPVKLEAGQRW